MNAKLTDDAVAGLPLSHGRAELLEEIMRTPVLDDRPIRTETPRRRTRLLVPAAAAVLVAALAVGTAWWAGGTGGDGEKETEVATQPVAGDRVLLDAPGWAATAMHSDEDTGELSYENGRQSLEVMWGPAGSYDGYVEDRRHIVDPPADGDPIEMLGADAQMWAYSADDHTAIREVVDGRWFEVRADGMDEAGYLALLERLRLVDLAGFEAALPETFVTTDERRASIDEILDGVAEAAGRALPEGWTRGSIVSDQTDPYQLGAEVTGQVTCAWVGQYVEARAAGDTDAADQAVQVMSTSRAWPVFAEMAETGEWPQFIWQIADDLEAGHVTPGWEQTCASGAP